MHKKTKKRKAPRGANAARERQKKKRKLAIVMSGGGMRCAYSAGVMTALVEKFNLTEPDIVVAASGSAGNSAYYLAGQYMLGAVIWIQKISGSRLVSFKRRRFLNIDYLIDEVFKKQHPLNIKELRAKKTRWLVPVTRVRDGETVFLSPPRNQDVYEYLRAAKAVPFIYGKEVRIGKEEYIDGDFGSNFGDLIQKAIQEGAADIVAMDCSPGIEGSKRRKILIEAAYYREKISGNAGLMKAAKHEMQHVPIPTVPGVRIVVLAPRKNMRLSLLARKKLELRSLLNLGYADAANNEELAKLLEDHAPTRRKPL